MNKTPWWMGAALLCALTTALTSQTPQAQAPTDPVPELRKKKAECERLFPVRSEEASQDLIEKKKRHLRGASLRGLELPYADLSGLDLSGADLTGSNLHEVDLTKARLEGAKLLLANLEGANLEDASLEGADLRGATLDSITNMRRLQSPPAKLPPGWVSVQHSDILDATQEEVEVEGGTEEFSSHSAPELEPWAVLGSGSDASYLKLHKADFTGANLQKTDFEGADLRGANFTGAKLQGASFTKARLKGAIWSKTTCPDGTKSDEAADKTCNKHLKAAASKANQKP